MSDVYSHCEQELLAALQRLTAELRQPGPGLSDLLTEAGETLRTLEVEFSSLKYKPPELKQNLDGYRTSFKEIQKKVALLADESTQSQPPSEGLQECLLRKGNQSLVEATRAFLEADAAASGVSTSLADQSEQIARITGRNQQLGGELTFSHRTIESIKRRIEKNALYVKVAVSLAAATVLGVFFLA